MHLMMENLFLHNNHWKDNHMVTVWQCGMGMKGWQKLWLKGWSGGVRQRGRIGLFGGAGWGVVGGKQGGGFKDGR